MSDAVSTIGLGIDTGTGKKDLDELRAAFAGLKAEVRELNELKANASGLVNGTADARKELTTLSAELTSAKGKIVDLENQLRNLGTTQAAAARSAAQSIKSSVEEQARAVIDSETRQAEATQRLAKETTKVVRDENAKRFSSGQSAKVGNVSYSMKAGSTETEFNRAAAAAEKTRLEIAANAQQMLTAEVDRGEARRREVMANSQAMLVAEVDRAEARKLEVQRTAQQMLMADADRADAQRLERNATAQAMLIAETERSEARKLEVQRTARAMAMADADRADATRREKSATSQAMTMATIDREEQRKVEVQRNARTMLMADADRAEATRREKQATAQAMLVAEVERAEAKKAEVQRTAQAMTMAEADRADATRREKQKVANDQMIAETERAEQRRQAILNNNFRTASLGSQVTTVRRAQGLNDPRLAQELYGSQAVASIGLLSQMEAKLKGERAQGNVVLGRSTDLLKVNSEAMKEAHSFARGLAGGLDQLWLTWGSVVPLAAGAAITGSLVKMYEAGKDVEYQLQFVKALSEDKKGVNLDSFLKITDGTMSSVKEAAGGMRALSQAGLNQRDALKALPDILDLAAIGEMSVGQAALSATGVMNAFNLKVQDIGHIGDVFSKVASASNTSVVGMTESMKQASTVSDMYHVSLEQTAATIGVLGQRNIMGTAAGTSLANALKSLYEPSEKAKQTLKMLHVETDDGHGGLKEYTQLFKELSVALSQYDDKSKTDILGNISDQRGAKTISAITSGMKEYDDFLKKAMNTEGFMSKATLDLEDTVEGASRRMANTFDGSLNKAFEVANPSIRELQAELTKLAGSDSVVTLLSKIAMAGVEVTRTILDNVRVIGIAAAAYLGLRVVSSLAVAFQAWKISVAESTIALAANAGASAVNAAALQAEAVAAGEAAAAAGVLASGMRLVTASLGPISLLLMAAYTGYEILTANIEKNDNTTKRALNTADTVIDYYTRQIEKLRELNAQLLEGGKNSEEFANKSTRAILNAQLGTSNARIEAMKKNQASPEAAFAARVRLPGGGSMEAPAIAKANAELEAEVKNRERIMDTLLNLDNKETEYKAASGLNKKLNDKRKVRDALDDLINSSGLGLGLEGAGTEKSRAIGQELEGWRKKLDSDTEAYKELAKLIPEYRDKINEAKGHFTPKDTKADNDIYKAQQAKMDGELQAIRDGEKSKLADVKSRNSTGEIGDLQAVAENLAIVKQARKDELEVFQRKEDAAAKQENRRRDTQGIQNKKDANQRADEEADKEAGRQRSEILSKYQDEDLRSEAETMRKKGDLVGAYLAEYESKYRIALSKVNDDIKNSTSPDQLDALNRHRDTLTNQFNAGKDSASFDQTKNAYDALMAQMQERLNAVSEKNARTNESASSPGFLSDLGAAKAADDIRNELQPALEKLLDTMQALSTKSGDSRMQATTSNLSNQLIKDANRSRDAWIAAGKSIEKSLADSFGKGGKAVGGVIQALIKQRETQKGLDDDLAKEKGKAKNDPIKQMQLEDKARQDSAALQLSTYADITGAAKGFFNTNSKGYEALQKAEQVFRAFELAQATYNFLKKEFFTTTEVASTIQGEAAKGVAITAGSTLSVAASTREGMAAAPAAVAAQGKGDPYSAWARMALMAATMAALGFAVSGGGGSAPPVDVAKERQKYTGTGVEYAVGSNSNPYDWELEKSDSLSKSLDKIKENSDIALTYSSSQLDALQSISDGISGLASSLVGASGIRGTRADELALGVGSSRSFLGFSSSSTSLTDSGIQFSTKNAGSSILQQGLSQSIGDILKNGVLAKSYADTHSESSSWFGLSKSSSDNTSYGNLDGDLLKQMGSIIKTMYSTVESAGKFLGKDNTTLEAALNSVTLREAGLDKVSLKGLSSDDVQKTLNAAFSKLGDIMAERALPGLDAFEKSGEGYLTTLIRVSSGIDSANYSLQKLGITAVNYTDILNKQGDVATEIVRDSIGLKEVVGGTSTGIGAIIKGMSGSVDDLTSTYQKLDTVRKTMTVSGSSKADVTTAMVRGAGGLDNLSTGVSDFLDNFFTDAEKVSAKAEMLSTSFTSLGVAMPKSKDDFKSLIQGIDRTTESGQTLYGALVSLSGQFSELADNAGIVNPLLTKQRAGIADLTKTAQNWLDVISKSRSMVTDITTALSADGKADNSARIDELKQLLNAGTGSFEQQLDLAGQLKDLVLEKYQTEKQNALDLINYGKDLNKYVTSLKTGDLSPLTSGEKLKAAADDYATTLSNTNSSDKDIRDAARSEIQDKANTYLDAAHTYYTSSQQYKDIFADVTTQLGNLGTSSIEQGKTVQELNQNQVDELVKLRDLAKGIQDQAQVEYDGTKSQLNTQINLLQQMADGLGTLSGLPDLLKGMPSELAAALGNSGTVKGSAGSNSTARDQIESLYETIFKRQGDSTGLDFWTNAYQSGQITLDGIRNNFLGSDEYTSKVRTDKAAMAADVADSQAAQQAMAQQIANLTTAVNTMTQTSETNTQNLAQSISTSMDSAADKINDGYTSVARYNDFDKRNTPEYQ